VFGYGRNELRDLEQPADIGIGLWQRFNLGNNVADHVPKVANA
jgi:hypothetical protein